MPKDRTYIKPIILYIFLVISLYVTYYLSCYIFVELDISYRLGIQEIGLLEESSLCRYYKAIEKEFYDRVENLVYVFDMLIALLIIFYFFIRRKLHAKITLARAVTFLYYRSSRLWVFI